MKKLIVLLLLGMCSSAQAQLSLSALTNLINTIFADNTNNAITPATLRTGLVSIAVSSPNMTDGGVTQAEFSYGSTVNANIQTSLNARELIVNKNQPTGYAGLDSSGLLDIEQLPNPNHAFGTASLSGGTYTSSDAHPPYLLSSVYPPRYAVNLRCTTINSGSELLKVGNGPAKAIVISSGLAVPSGDINPNGIHEFVFNGNADKWVLINPASMGAFSASFTISTNESVVTVDLADGGVSLAKMANIATSRVIGRATAGSGVPEELTVGSALTVSGGTLDVPNAAITLAKQANLANGVIVGRANTGTGVPEQIVIGSGLTIGTPGGIPTLTAAGSVSVPVWTPPDPSQWADYSFEDFSSGSATVGGWTGTIINSGTISTLGATESIPSGMQLSTVTNANGGYMISRASNSRLIGANSTNVVEWRLTIPTASDGTESFYVDVGFIDTADPNDTDGAFVRYTHDLNGGNATIRTVVAGSPVETDGTVATPINSYFKVMVAAQATSFKSWIYTTSATNALAVVTTGIPSSVGQQVSPGIRIIKRAGTTTRQISVDYVRTWVGYSSPLR